MEKYSFEQAQKEAGPMQGKMAVNEKLGYNSAEKEVELEQLHVIKKVLLKTKEQLSRASGGDVMLNFNHYLKTLDDKKITQKTHSELFPAVFIKEAKFLLERLNEKIDDNKESGRDVIMHNLKKFIDYVRGADLQNKEFHLLAAKFIADATSTVGDYGYINLYKEAGEVEKFNALEKVKKEAEKHPNDNNYWIELVKRGDDPEIVNLLKELTIKFLDDVDKLPEFDLEADNIIDKMVIEVDDKIKKQSN